MKKLLFILVYFITTKVSAQDPAYPLSTPAPLNIVKAEYFIDIDPGFGNAVDIPVSAALDINGLVQSINISTLSTGTHKLGVRSLNSEGEWSHTNVINFAIDPNYTTAPPAPVNIVKAEYFIDNDPGFGNAVDIPVSAALDINGLVQSINISTLSPGTHKLGVRSLNTEGEWSHTNVIIFGIDPNYTTAPPAPLNIVKAEYFIDTDPGFGNGINISLTAANDLPSLVENVNTSALLSGVHRMYVRSLNSEGEWSVTALKQFVVDENPAYPPAPATPGNITFAEYFIDTDPGFGNGINISLTAANDIPSLVENVNTSALLPGVHRIYVRSLNNEGEWSVTALNQFVVDENPAYPPAPAAPGNITFAEYFIDTDPGFGNGTPITLTPSTDISNLAFSVATASLSTGNHTLYVRSLDDWSLTAISAFDVNTALPLTFLSFNAHQKENFVQLKWDTENERNTFNFEVQHSVDGISFSTVGTIGAQNVSTRSYYHFNHLPIASGFHYYRLKQNDLNGHFTYSKIVKVLYNNKLQQIVIAPNPVADVLNIVLPKTVFITTITIYDAKGMMLLQKMLNNEIQSITLPVNTLAQGQYTLIIKDATETKTISFIKN